MKFTFVILALAFGNGAMAQNNNLKLDPKIRQSNLSSVPFVALMDITPSRNAKMPHRYNHQEVVSYLQDHTRTQYAQVQSALQNQRLAKSELNIIGVQYISASFSGVATKKGLEAIANIPNVTKIYMDVKVAHDPVTKSAAVFPARGEYPYDLKDMKVDQMRAAHPDYLGKGVVIGSVDTGVDGKHPALQGKIKLFYDARKHAVGDAVDYDEHGTHTAGTMVGTNPNGPMGMAPEAQLMVAGALGSLSEALEGMQFMLDPDKNPNTNDQPRAVNNSWNSGGASDQEPFYRAIAAWEAANVMPVWSAGNAGPKPGTITTPHEHPLTYAMAATQEDGKITSFSSRGPGKYKGQETQKPDAGAPGKNIISSVPGGKFVSMSGTSMSSPHATGATAILFQIKSDLNPAAVRKILSDTAANVDANGNPSPSKAWNATYGFGKLDMNAAVNMALAVRHRAESPTLGLVESLIKTPEMISVDQIMGLLGDQEALNPYKSNIAIPSWM